jgi:hypothetical protein
MCCRGSWKAKPYPYVDTLLQGAIADKPVHRQTIICACLPAALKRAIMFDGWQSFFGVLGSAAATLIGLLFVVVTLTAGRSSSPGNAAGTQLFTSPVVLHFVSVLAISALALAPGDEEIFKCLLMTGWGLAGLVYSAGLAWRITRWRNKSHWTDFWYYGVAPTAAYLALSFANGATWLHAKHAALLEGLSVLALLVIAIRNAWDLVTWLAPRRDSMSSS